MVDQLCLPLTGQTLCGYCDEPLVLQPAGDWACNRCRPLLALVRTGADWIRFHQDARRG